MKREKKEDKQFQKTEGLTKEADYRSEKISKNLDKNLTKIYEMMGHTAELKKRDFYLDVDKKVKLCFLYMNGIVDQTYINDTVFDNLFTNYERFKDKIDLTDFDTYHNFLVTMTEMEEAKNFGELMMGLLSGDTVFLIHGFDRFFIIGTRKFPERAIAPPTIDVTVAGPRDSFTENILTNLNLIRRRIKNPNLWLEKFYIGTDSNTDVFMVYLKGVAEESLVREVYNRIKSINIENVMDSSYIETYIDEKRFSLLPTLFINERPDVIVSGIFEGRVAIIVDGTPFVLIAPTVYTQFFQTAEDYYQKAYVTIFYRLLRIFAFYISLFLPAVYVTLVGLHSELLPFQLLVKIAGQRAGLPFPAYFEAILMCLIFDILREAGIRAPKTLGPSITTAGALVLGQSAVEAGIISPIMVVVVALTAISTLIIPHYRLQVKMVVLKYIFLLAGIVFGLFGLTLALILYYVHLCSIKSFGIPFYTPISPFNRSGQKDGIYKSPLKTVLNRPLNFTKRYRKR